MISAMDTVRLTDTAAQSMSYEDSVILFQRRSRRYCYHPVSMKMNLKKRFRWLSLCEFIRGGFGGLRNLENRGNVIFDPPHLTAKFITIIIIALLRFTLDVIFCSYAGPGTQKVTDQLITGYDAYLASNRRFVVAYIDGRGSGFRGWRYKQPILGHMGTIEIQDQIKTVRWGQVLFFVK